MTSTLLTSRERVEIGAAAPTYQVEVIPTGGVPMKYLIMLYGNPTTREWWYTLSDAEKAEAASGHFAIPDALQASGEMIHTEALADPATGQRVSVADGRAMTTDGPFAEVKEYLAGF